MTETKRLEKRMYFFVPYQLTGIQQGIQCGHAALEYAYEHGNSPDYIDFIRNDKTWIVLNGGSTRSFLLVGQDGFNIPGTLNQIENDLEEMCICYSSFREPDLENALTAVCFIADERVWNKKDYPDYLEWYQEKEGIILEYGEPEFDYWKELIGGEKNLFLRNLINGKKLA